MIWNNLAALCLVLAVVFSSSSFADYDYKGDLDLSTIPRYPWKRTKSIPSPTYHDIMENAGLANGQPWRYLRFAGPHGNAHETMHGYFDNHGRYKSHYFFYVEPGKGAFLPVLPGVKGDLRKPGILAPEVVRQTSIKQSSRSVVKEAASAYLTYIDGSAPGGQNSREFLAHVFQEWLCYVSETRVGIELLRAGYKIPLEDGGGDWINSDQQASFLYYSTAAAYVLSKKYPMHFKENTQLKALFALLAEKTMRNFYDSLELKDVLGKKISRYVFKHLLNGEASKHLTSFLVEWYDKEWVDRVFQPERLWETE